MADVDWREIASLPDDLYRASERLGGLFPGRKFTLDGHPVGSIGEVVAAYMFDLDLDPASTPGHDARAPDGRRVEIKLTQGTRVAFRHEADHALVLFRPTGGPVQTVFNGPGDAVWDAAGAMAKNGQRPIGTSRLRKLDAAIPDRLWLERVREAPV